jgi:hypothetical protein
MALRLHALGASLKDNPSELTDDELSLAISQLESELKVKAAADASAELTDRDVAISNEKTKLTATYINNSAVGVLTVGAVGPLISLFTVTAVDKFSAGLIAFICVLASGAIHCVAKWTLGDIR